jgi:pheromone shutdown-related protein TraB
VLLAWIFLEEPVNESPLPSDIFHLTVDDKNIALIGTAHISRESVDTVVKAINDLQPDTVCVELDQQRYQSLINQKGWESLNLKEVIRKKQLPFLLANLALSSYQKRMGLATGVQPGAELAAAAQIAEEQGLKVELVDRNIRTTLLRVWRITGLWNKMKVLASLFASLFEKQQVNEEELARLRQADNLAGMLEEMGELLPSVKQILVDERDTYMAYHIRRAPGDKIVAVVGAAHLPGIVARLQGEPSSAIDIDRINTIPPKSLTSKLIPWAIPLLVMALFIGGFFFANPEQMAQAAWAWILANGLFSAAGTLLAWGHPATIITAFIAAPLTSLNPTIGAGFVTALVQSFVAPPLVSDMQRVGEDLLSLKGWWHNRLARVLLVFLFSSLGSSIGTFFALGWIKSLF